MLNRKHILFFLLTIILLAGCSVEVRYNVLSYVFDGVPDPNRKEEVAINDTIYLNDSLTNTISQNVTNQPQIFFHSPYQKRKCMDCHDQNNIGELKDQMPNLCYKCHNNLSDKYQFLHGPVGAGYCNACHHPHYSENDQLLLKKEMELCLDCHLSKDIYANKLHQKQDNYSCYDCHNVHGGDDQSLLKPGTCYNCHEDLSNKYRYLHGPVGGGYCKSCHGSHTLKREHLLIEQGRSLCLHCHKEERLMETETHKEIPDADCTDCHNAHGGDSMNFLN